MPRASFYFNVQSRELALCQLAGKAVKQGQTVGIATDSEAASEVIDRLLWEQPHTGFLPHVAADHPLAAETPVLLDHRSEQLPARDVLFNWRNGLPGGLERHQRIIEIVAQGDEEGLQAARARVKAYRAAGFETEFTDMLNRT